MTITLKDANVSLDDYVRQCAGLGMVVRVYTWRCPVCGETTSAAQALNRDLATHLPLLIEIDGIMRAPGGQKIQHCGVPMAWQTPVTRDGAL